MGNVFTLDSLREELDREFAPLKFQDGNTEYVLRNVLRLGKTERKAVLEKLRDLETDDEDKDVDPDVALDAILFILATVADTKAKGEKLVKLIGDDLALAMKLMEHWTEATQPGEAEPSES